jgi:glucosyl-3-phosphoglycerate synthase
MPPPATPPATSSPAEPSNERAKVRTFHHSAYTAQAIASARAESGLGVTVCLPARDCAATVGEIVGALAGLREAGAIDRIVVVDAASSDGTAQVAEAAGAEVWQEDELLPSFGPVLGKGDAMWRALSRIDTELVCFIDADSEQFSAHFVTGLLGPLVCEPDVAFVKAFYRRPLAGDGAPGEGSRSPQAAAAARGSAGSPDAAVKGGSGGPAEGGGRINHLTARPALALFYPELAEVRQPLAGEVAARRELFERLPFATGYGVEIAMLIDVWHAVGLQRIAQVDLEVHHNRHQPLSALAPMALTVLATLARRMEQEGRLAFGVGDHAPLERPPLASLPLG